MFRYEAFVTCSRITVVLVVFLLLAALLPVVTLLSGGQYIYLPAASTCVSPLTWSVVYFY